MDTPFTVTRLVELIRTPQGNEHLQALHNYNSDVRILAGTLDGEGRGENIHGRLAIGHVVKNRRELFPRDKGKSYWEVCLRKSQFECWWPGSSKGSQQNAARCLLMQEWQWGQSDLVHAIHKRMFNETKWLADGIIQGKTVDPTQGATHYLTKQLFNSSQCPSWAEADKICAIIGNHYFLRGVA